MPASLEVQIGGWDDGQRIPDRFALGKLGSPMEMSDNVSPEISWSGAPDGTRSIAIIVSDPDVPSVADDVNQPDREVPADLPRITFTHWVLVDLPASMTSISEGAASREVTARGKRVGESLGGITGANDYTSWFAGDPDMGGVYGGYDGPCPPWNDSIMHHYHFEVFALDLDSLGLSAEELTGPAAREAMADHVVAAGSYVGIYSLNAAIIGA